MAENAQKNKGLQSQIGQVAAAAGGGRPRVPAGESSAERGARGEALAAEFLRRQRGFAILARNWHNPNDRREEIDLVARNAAATVFVEVKTRRNGSLVPGYFAVGRRKRKALGRAIRAYLSLHPGPPHTFRFDVIEVELGAGPPVIRHFENAGIAR